MSGKFSRSKGQRGEREVAAIIHELTGWSVKRRVRQHDGDSDLEGVDGWSIEVKNCATLAINQWWNQAVEQAGEDLFPVLFYKIPRKGWRAMWPLSAIVNHEESQWNDIEFACDTTIQAWACAAVNFIQILAEMTEEEKNAALNSGESLH